MRSDKKPEVTNQLLNEVHYPAGVYIQETVIEMSEISTNYLKAILLVYCFKLLNKTH